MLNTKFITQHNMCIGICQYNILYIVMQPRAWKCVIPLVCVCVCVCLWKLEQVCSQTQLHQLRRFNDYTIILLRNTAHM